MHRAAHRWFAGGFCAVLCLLFNFTAYSIAIVSMVAMWLGPLPDADQRVPFFRHRGFSHSPWFAIIITVPVSILLAYLLWFANGAIGASVFTTSVLSSDGALIPGSLYYIARGDVVSFLSNPATLAFFALFLGMITHIMLDVITPSGVDLWRWHISGGILSDNAMTNKMFSLVGIVMLASAIALSAINTYSSTSLSAAILMGSLISVVTGVFIASVFVKDRKQRAALHCYSVEGEDFCTKKKCVNIKGKEICVQE